MGKKSQAKKNRNRWRKVAPDEVINYGPLQVARYGRFLQLKNTATPEQHAAILAKKPGANKVVVSELAAQVGTLQELVQQHDPVEIMHRAAYVLLPLFFKYRSENEFERDESYALAAVEYLQYIISRTSANTDGKKIEETEWETIWSATRKCLELAQSYLFTRKTTSSPPSELDALRFSLDARRLLVRVRRYPIYFTDHLRDSLVPYDDAIKEAYGMDLNELLKGLEAINEYQKTGVVRRYQALKEANEALVRKLMERGFRLIPRATEQDAKRLRIALQTPEFEKLDRDLQEKARLTLTPAIFDVTDISTLPRTLLTLLSVHPAEAVLTTLTGPNHDDLSPLSTSVLHHKPFLEKADRYYYFYHSGFEDRIAEIIESDLFRRFPDRAAPMRRRRDSYQESVATELVVRLVRPDLEHRNLFYPDPDQPGGITEVDALLVTDDVLFIVEVKAGGLSEAASRGAPQSLFGELADTIGTGQRQSERAERCLKSLDEVPFFDTTGKREVCRLRHSAFRRVFRIVITREDLGWVGARLAVLSVIDPQMNGALPWHVSLDDLRIVADLFQDSELRFVHFLEQRLKASSEASLHQHDEIEHVALYNHMNLYHELSVKGMDRITYDPSHMRDIDTYFSEKYQGGAPELPRQQFPARLASLLRALKDSRQAGRLAAASTIYSMNEVGRTDVERALGHLDKCLEERKQRSFRVPFTSAGYGLTVTYTEGEHWDEELLRSAAQMEQGRCEHWVVIQLERRTPYTIRRLERLCPGRYSDMQLAPSRAHIEARARHHIQERRVGRNERCPCGSGKKYKKCHGK